jgi:hypothetical protein
VTKTNAATTLNRRAVRDEMGRYVIVFVMKFESDARWQVAAN